MSLSLQWGFPVHLFWDYICFCSLGAGFFNKSRSSAIALSKIKYVATFWYWVYFFPPDFSSKKGDSNYSNNAIAHYFVIQKWAYGGHLWQGRQNNFFKQKRFHYKDCVLWFNLSTVLKINFCSLKPLPLL